MAKGKQTKNRYFEFIDPMKNIMLISKNSIIMALRSNKVDIQVFLKKALFIYVDLLRLLLISSGFLKVNIGNMEILTTFVRYNSLVMSIK